MNIDNTKYSHSFLQTQQTLYFECVEGLPHLEEHAILTPGLAVRISFEKSTRLEVVMRRYLEVCNESSPSAQKIEWSELEFRHVEVLRYDLTAETAALMKNDRVYVHRNQADERAMKLLQRAQQKALDVEFKRVMLNDLLRSTTGNVILQSKNTFNQARCHDFMLRKRCSWLYEKIQEQRGQKMSSSTTSSMKDDEDDGEDDVVPMNPQGEPPEAAVAVAAAQKIEDDNDDKLIVYLDFSLAAIILVLEYIYTDQVSSLEDSTLDVTLEAAIMAREAGLESLMEQMEEASANLVKSHSDVAVVLRMQKDHSRLLPKSEIIRKRIVEVILQSRAVPKTLVPDMVSPLLRGTVEVLLDRGVMSKNPDVEWYNPTARRRSVKRSSMDHDDRTARREERRRRRLERGQKPRTSRRLKVKAVVKGRALPLDLQK